MRILSLIVKYLIILLLLALVGGLLGREILLTTAVNNIKNSLIDLRKSANQGAYQDQCAKKGIQLEAQDRPTFQLRFTSPTEYVLEAICGQLNRDPISLGAKQSLPKFVKKVSHNAGIIWGSELSGVRLAIYNRSAAVGVLDEEIVKFDQDQEFGLGPVSVCEGYGFNCCQPESLQGTGQQLTGVLNCANSCYTSCVARPMVLSFNSQPFPGKQNRTVRITNGQEVIFSYVIDSSPKDQLAVKLSFGDGKAQSFSTPQDSASHVYQCLKDSCIYTAWLGVTNQAGVSSADLPISKIKIVVRR
jgi:hypothetical protein